MNHNEVLQLLSRDLVSAAKTLTPKEARYLVDAYYMIQDNRKIANSQVLALSGSEEPHDLIKWLRDQNAVLENQIKRTLDSWTDTLPSAVWAKSITGIGPVISAGLAAHIDIAKAPTVGHIWRYAGLLWDKWEKGEKRPWNASLKVLCWKIGESFVKFSGNKNDFYGKLYLQRKTQEERYNNEMKFSAQAEEKLKNFNIGKDKKAYEIYKSGLLPPGHIHARAKRWTVKLFLSHYKEVSWWLAYNEAPPKPFTISIMGHGDYIPPPNFTPPAQKK